MMKLIKTGLWLMMLSVAFCNRYAWALSDVSGVTIEFPKRAYGINAEETQVKVSVSSSTGTTPTVQVKIEFPNGGQLLNPSGNPFPVRAGTPKFITIKLPSTPGNKKFVAKVVGTTRQGSDEVEAIRLDSVRVLYHNDSSTANDATNPYPSTNDTIKITAVVRATGANGQRLYMRTQETNDGRWWNAGVDGPQAGPFSGPPPAGYSTTPNLSVTDFPTIYAWPATWPVLNKAWVKLKHQASGPTSTASSGYANRNYTYATEALNWNSWDRTQRFPRGMMRYRVKVTLHTGKTWAQNRISDDLDGNGISEPQLSTRIAVRDAEMPNDLLQWSSSYLDEPYELGGYWYGGRVGNNDGGDHGYEGYGMECAGMIGGAALRSGYGWENLPAGPDGYDRDRGRNAWRPSTGDIIRPGYSTAITEAELEPGDIVVRSGSHVVVCSRVNRSDPDPTRRDIISIIHASGGSRRVLEQSKRLGADLEGTMGGSYQCRRLRDY